MDLVNYKLLCTHDHAQINKVSTLCQGLRQHQMYYPSIQGHTAMWKTAPLEG